MGPARVHTAVPGLAQGTHTAGVGADRHRQWIKRWDQRVSGRGSRHGERAGDGCDQHQETGFPAAVNQGLRLARGEYLVLLNNDVIVTDAWLDQLIAPVNAKRGPDSERAGASGNASADWGGRPTVESGAGSGDPRTAPSAPRIGDHSSSNGAGPGAGGDRVGDGTGPTPPGPPFARGGKSDCFYMCRSRGGQC
jgi:Glycosyl transferase family 2